jgi:ribonucleoside-diphosphate reductase beta chain
MITEVVKRNGEVEPYDREKIVSAISKAMQSVGRVNKDIANTVSLAVQESFTDYAVDVDKIHRKVEDTLMDHGLHDIAREYITYRFTHMPDIFRKRTNLKPYEYPQLLEYVDAIRHSYWVHTEFNYQGDIQDLKVNLSEAEAGVVKRAMLAISQIEVQVKTFWAKLGDKMPKPEVQAVGVTFGESEVRHADAYSNLLEIMGLNDEFKTLVDVPAIKNRIEYLEQALSYPVDNKEYFHNIILFSMFVENVSLFSQFLIMMSFNKHKNVLKGISNAVEATSKEEDIHAKFGFELVNIIKQEHPDWWGKDVESHIKALTRQAFKAECSIVDWIYGDIDLDFLPKDTVKEFLKHRFNRSLTSIGMKSVFEANADIIKSVEWFEDELTITKDIDFFVKKSVNYQKKTKSFSEDDLF